VAVARAIVSKPAIVLADEPTANLDSTTSRELVELMLSLNRKHGTTFLISTHDPLVIELAPRRISLRDGQIVGDEAA
jgi:putative ABC transport system ATP-binding protein